MYAIIKTGGKQYRVGVGDIIDVELLQGSTEPGTQVNLGEVLFAHDGSKAHFGQAGQIGFTVQGEVLGTVKGDKVTSLKYKRSHNQCRKWGHRQKYTRVKITGIENQQAGKGG